MHVLPHCPDQAADIAHDEQAMFCSALGIRLPGHGCGTVAQGQAVCESLLSTSIETATGKDCAVIHGIDLDGHLMSRAGDLSRLLRTVLGKSRIRLGTCTL